MRCVSTSGAFPSSAASPLWGSYTPPPRCPFSSCSRDSRRPSGASSPKASAAPQRLVWRRCLSVQRHEDAVAQPPVECLREMALAPRVLDKDDLTRADAARLAVARGELNARVEIDDVLPARGRMPVEVVVGRHLAEDDPGRRKAPRQPPGTGRLLELHLHVLEMRLASLVDVEPVDLHGTVSACTGPSGRPSPAC